MVRSISALRPIKGSIFPSAALLFKSTQYASSASRPCFTGFSSASSSSAPSTGRDSDFPGTFAMP